MPHIRCTALFARAMPVIVQSAAASEPRPPSQASSVSMGTPGLPRHDLDIGQFDIKLSRGAQLFASPPPSPAASRGADFRQIRRSSSMHIVVRSSLLALAAPCLVAGLAAPAAAQNDARISGFFTLGALSTPEYQGSSDRIIGPLVAARLAYGANYIETATLSAGFAVRANVSPWPDIEFGPVLGQRRGRSDVENERVRLLEDIDDSFEAGVFIRLPFRDVLDSRDEAAIEVQFQGDVSSTASGNLLIVGGSYRFNPHRPPPPRRDRPRDLRERSLQPDVLRRDRGRRRRQRPAGVQGQRGIRDVGLTFTANYEITGGWGITGVVQLSAPAGRCRRQPDRLRRRQREPAELRSRHQLPVLTPCVRNPACPRRTALRLREPGPPHPVPCRARCAGAAAAAAQRRHRHR